MIYRTTAIDTHFFSFLDFLLLDFFVKVTHIFVLCIEHHVIPYINFIKEELDKTHYKSNILVYSKQATEKLSSLQDNQVTITPMRNDVVNTIKNANSSHKVIIHGFYDSVIFFKLLFSISQLKFVSWAMWGADVYYTPPQGIRGMIIKYCRKKVIPRIGNKLGLHCDYVWLFNQLKVKDKGEFNEICFPAWFYQETETCKQHRLKINCGKQELSALIGNSADPTNNFIELIDLLKYTKIFTQYTFVLNYGGSPAYINKIKKHAKQNLLNCKLVFLTEKLAYQKYIEVVAQHDSLVYNHSRQQGVGSLNIAFELGLSVIIPEHNPMTNNYKNWQVKTFSTESIATLSINDLQRQSYKEQNRKIIQNYYHPKNVAKKLMAIIESD